ncbi:MAG: WYL domain-containing protein, partial [Marinosulfonomonas sp.]|nr:WYL domain-containing protein [Marinosulfonomonas sp.]
LSDTLFASSWGPEAPANVNLSDIRNAIRQTRKIKISYRNEAGSNSHRTILPLAIIYYAQSIVLAAWCELRGGFRHFRADRISSHTVLSEKFSEQSPALHQNGAQTHVTNL